MLWYRHHAQPRKTRADASDDNRNSKPAKLASRRARIQTIDYAVNPGQRTLDLGLGQMMKLPRPSEISTGGADLMQLVATLSSACRTLSVS
jgi:hypothetical protein